MVQQTISIFISIKKIYYFFHEFLNLGKSISVKTILQMDKTMRSSRARGLNVNEGASTSADASEANANSSYSMEMVVNTVKPKRRRLSLNQGASTSSISIPHRSYSTEMVDQIERNSLSILNDDCLIEIFKRMRIRRLTALSATCKRFYELSEPYLRAKCPSGGLFVTIEMENNKIRCVPRNLHVKYSKMIKLNADIYYNLLPFAVWAYKDKGLKHISFENVNLAKSSNQKYLQELLEGIEVIRIDKCDLDVNIENTILKFCPNLKYLDLCYKDNRAIISANDFFEHFHEVVAEAVLGPFRESPPLKRFEKHEWLWSRYPNLKFLAYDVSTNNEITSNHIVLWVFIKQFFRYHPNIEIFYPKKLSARSILFEIKRNQIKLNGLCVELGDEDVGPFPTIVMLLQLLQSENSYASLHLIIKKGVMLSEPFYADGLVSLTNLHGLYANFTRAPNYSNVVNFISQMTNLKSLLIYIASRRDAEELSTKLLNLEEIFIRYEKLSVVEPFVWNLPKLHTIYLIGAHTYFDPRLEPKAQALNERRKLLPGACQVNIYDKYSSHTNLELIKIQPYDFLSLNNPFARFFIMDETAGW